MTPKGHAIPSKTQLLSYGTPAFPACLLRSHIIYFILPLVPQLANSLYVK